MSSTSTALEAKTLIELLAARSDETGDLTAYDFCGERCTFAELWDGVEACADSLVANQVERGDRVIMVLPNGHDFFTAFYGIQRVGAIAVPIFSASTPERIVGFAALCGARHVIVPSTTPPETLAKWRRQVDHLVIVSADHRVPAETSPKLSMPRPDDVAFIQYTSGTTGDPKGVQLSHANLLTNVRQMISGMGITADDRFVSWLPTYHDMGLILMTMTPFYLAAPLYLLPADLSDTRAWLDTIERHRCTFTASPDFGYRLAMRRLAATGPDRGGVPDLSSLRVALNAAEPVRKSTVDAFHETFGLHDVMVGAYGLAEATVGVSMWTPSTTNRVDDGGAVSAGLPFPDVTVTILDDDDRQVAIGEAGHIAVTSPANTRGYFRNPDATKRLFVDDDTIRTGDIGYVDADGHLYILGRANDVIIQAGQTIYPEDVEELVNAVTGVRYSVALGVDSGRVQGEQVVVIAEVNPDRLIEDAARKQCVIAIIQTVRDRFGVRPARVHLVTPKTISMTPNGKLRRQDTKRRYLADEFGDAIVFPHRMTRDTEQ